MMRITPRPIRIREKRTDILPMKIHAMPEPTIIPRTSIIYDIGKLRVNIFILDDTPKVHRGALPKKRQLVHSVL